MLAGGAAICSTVLLSACGGEEAEVTTTKTVTNTATTTALGETTTVTATAVGGGAFDPAKHFLYNAWEELSWAQVYASKDFGETYNWYTTVMAQADVT